MIADDGELAVGDGWPPAADVQRHPRRRPRLGSLRRATAVLSALRSHRLGRLVTAAFPFVLTAAGLICAMFAVYTGAPVLGRGWSPVPLVAGGAGAAAAVALARQSSSRRVLLNAATALCLFLLLSFTWGLISSVSVDGTLYPAWSDTAKVHRLSEEIADARAEFSRVDELLALPDNEAKARFRELAPARDRMASLNSRWATMEVDSLPAGEFVPVATLMSTASYAGAQALQDKIALLASTDARLAAELKLQREQFVTAVLTLDSSMADLAGVWSFTWGLSASELE